MNNAFWINALVLGLKILLGIGIVALAIYMQYRRRMRWSMRHDLLEKTGIQTVSAEDHSRDPYDDPELNKLK